MVRVDEYFDHGEALDAAGLREWATGERGDLASRYEDSAVRGAVTTPKVG